MSEFVRLGARSGQELRVDLEMFERVTHNLYPWVQTGAAGGKKRRFGLCPECENAMVLVNITNPSQMKRPHGRHSLRAIEGFEHNLEAILRCDLFNPSGARSVPEELTELTPEAVQCRKVLIENFHLAVGILQEDIGIALSPRLLASILDTFFEEGWYRWPTVRCENVPWLFMRTGTSYALMGQGIRPESALAKVITRCVPEACFGPYGRLQARPGQRVNLWFGISNHKITLKRDAQPCETVEFKVVRVNERSEDAPEVIFERNITLRGAEFMSRVHLKRDASGYGLVLLKTAQAALERYLSRHPEARFASEVSDEE